MSLFLTLLLWSLGIGGFVIAFNMVISEDMSIPANRSIVAMGIACMLWCCGYACMTACDLEHTQTAYIARGIALLGIYLFLPAVVLFISSLADVDRKTIDAMFSFTLIGGLVIAALVSQPNIVEFVPTGHGLMYKSHTGMVRYLQAAYTLVVFGFSTYCVIRLIRSRKKRREKTIVVTYFIAGSCLILGMAFDTIYPTFGGVSFPGSPIGAFFGVGILFYLIKYHNAFTMSQINMAQYLYRCMGTAILAVNGDDVIETVSEHTHALIDMRRSQLLGKNWMDVFAPDEDIRKRAAAISTRKMFDADFGSLEFKWTSPKKRKFTVNLNVIYDKYGDSICSILVFTDMTDDIRMMEELEKSRMEAEKANKAKSDFLASMSHEIRTPMNTILGMNEMILRESDSDNVRKYAENISTSGEALLSIINDILDFSKIESGKMEIIPVRYSLARVVHEVSRQIIQKLDAKGISYEVDFDPTIPESLVGADVRVQQIILNLLTNAAKYTEKGRVSLKTVWNPSDSAVTIMVTDTGIGIREEDRKRLFEAFERLDATRNRSIEGTGLGLAIVSSLLHKMGSELEVTSEYGKGSCFSFTIRQEEVGAAPTGDYQEYVKKLETDTPKHVDAFRAEGRTVLVVDDNRMNLMVFKGLLKNSGMLIDTAGSGEECLKMVAEKHYDIIFMDHMMPKMDGIETFKRLREGNNLCLTTPVVALTANAISGAENMYLEEGFAMYLSKPVKPAELEAAIRNVLTM